MRQKSTAIQEQLDADQRQLSQANEDNQSLREKVNDIELNLQTEKNTLKTSKFLLVVYYEAYWSRKKKRINSGHIVGSFLSYCRFHF